jgi:hypothetical protein
VRQVVTENGIRPLEISANIAQKHTGTRQKALWSTGFYLAQIGARASRPSRLRLYTHPWLVIRRELGLRRSRTNSNGASRKSSVRGRLEAFQAELRAIQASDGEYARRTRHDHVEQANHSQRQRKRREITQEIERLQNLLTRAHS